NEKAFYGLGQESFFSHELDFETELNHSLYGYSRVKVKKGFQAGSNAIEWVLCHRKESGD
ncbi:hypothetical protein HAX54_008777, partial [Datura stramonium]|nr:hypothetical protein [Datura stramonium]